MKRSTPGRQDTKLRKGAVACGARGMGWARFSLWLAVLLCMLASAGASGQTPTPTCNPPGVSAYISPTSPVLTFVPGVPFTLSFNPTAGDWPTTPTNLLWLYNHPVHGHTVLAGTSSTQEFLFPPPEFDELQLRARASGPGIRPECPSWTTGSVGVIIRRFDYEPTPTPTPEPTPCDPACDCVPRPAYRCDETTPTRSAVGVPPGDLIVEFEPPYPGDPEGVFMSIRGMPGGTPTYQWYRPNWQKLAFNRIRVYDLRPNYYYEFYWKPTYDACGNEVAACFSWFNTGDATPTPTPTPLPGDGWYLSQNSSQRDDRSSAEVRR